MAKEHSKTAAQQHRYYEVDNIFEYMVEIYINGNLTSSRRLYHELGKETKKDLICFLIMECPPRYHIEILQQTVQSFNAKRMDAFSFYRDYKVTCWKRTRFSIKANNYEEMKAVILSQKDKDVNSRVGIDKDVVYSDYELNPETVEGLSSSKNDSNPTVGIYGEADELLYDNIEDGM